MKKFIMKRILTVGALIACAVIAPVATAQAATTTSHCDTDKATYYVTKDGRNKIKVNLEAHGCVEHTVEATINPDTGSNVTCSRVTVVQAWRKPFSKVDFLDKKVKTEWSWKKRDTQYRPFKCSALDNSNSEQTEYWGGKYRYKSGFTKRCAFPMLKVIVRDNLGASDASQIVSEDIVQIKKVSGWTFKKCKKNGRNGNGGNPPATQLPAAEAVPMPNGGDAYGGMRGGDVTMGPPLPTSTGRNGH